MKLFLIIISVFAISYSKACSLFDFEGSFDSTSDDADVIVALPESRRSRALLSQSELMELERWILENGRLPFDEPTWPKAQEMLGLQRLEREQVQQYTKVNILYRFPVEIRSSLRKNTPTWSSPTRYTSSQRRELVDWLTTNQRHPLRPPKIR